MTQGAPSFWACPSGSRWEEQVKQGPALGHPVPHPPGVEPGLSPSPACGGSGLRVQGPAGSGDCGQWLEVCGLLFLLSYDILQSQLANPQSPAPW